MATRSTRMYTKTRMYAARANAAARMRAGMDDFARGRIASALPRLFSVAFIRVYSLTDAELFRRINVDGGSTVRRARRSVGGEEGGRIRRDAPMPKTSGNRYARVKVIARGGTDGSAAAAARRTYVTRNEFK